MVASSHAMRVWVSLLVAAAVAAGALLGWSRLFAVRPHAVILITVDTLRADRLSCYGYKESSTPAIDHFASQGALFSETYCDIPFTTGSMASVMTGTYGAAHGVQTGGKRLAESQTTLAEMLHAHGWSTAAVVGSFPLDRVYGLDQGFDLYDCDFTLPMLLPQEPADKILDHIDVDDLLSNDEDTRNSVWLQKVRNDARRSDAEVTATAVNWLERARRPFFLWVHYFGPHERLYEGEQYPAARILADYDRDLRQTDAAVGDLLAAIDRLGLAADAMVILHADHGQSLGEHERIGHGRDLYEPTVRIPLLVRFPPLIHAGLRLDVRARNVDILATILESVGLSLPSNLAGRSLLPALRGSAMRPVPVLMQMVRSPRIRFTVPGVGDFYGPLESEAVRDGEWKFVHTALLAPCERATHFETDKMAVNPRPVDGVRLDDAACVGYQVEALYNVGGDKWPAPELVDLSAQRPDLVARLRPLALVNAPADVPGEPANLTDAQKERLRSLGYGE